MKPFTLMTTAASLMALVNGRFSPACHGWTSDACGCCKVWSYYENACLEAGPGPGPYKTCFSLFDAPIGSAMGPKGCGIWNIKKRKCEEWLDGTEDGYTQPDTGPDALQSSVASSYGSTVAPTPTGPLLTVVNGKTQVVDVPKTSVEAKTQVVTSTSVVLVTSAVAAVSTAPAKAVVTETVSEEVGGGTAETSQRMVAVTVTA